MAFRWDIPKKLIYTCNCGWFDKGHANGSGPSRLWKDLTNATDKYRQNGIEGFKVNYFQDTVAGGITFNKHSQDFFVKGNLSDVEKAQVALAIFQEVSLGFEAQQISGGIKGFFVENFGPASGFSEEDLVSNIAGFYKALRQTDWVSLCKPVSEEASLKIWDRDGPVGWNKNRIFLPNFHKCDECSDNPQFPLEYQSIQPLQKGILHFDFDKTGARPLYDGSRNPFLFDRGFNRNPFGLGFLEIPKQVKLQVNQGESQYLFCRRALMQAGFVAGLYSFEQWEYADKFYPLGQSFEKMSSPQMDWKNGDPSSDGQKVIKPTEFADLYGEEFTYNLSQEQQDALKSMLANRFSFNQFK